MTCICHSPNSQWTSWNKDPVRGRFGNFCDHQMQKDTHLWIYVQICRFLHSSKSHNAVLVSFSHLYNLSYIYIKISRLSIQRIQGKCSMCPSLHLDKCFTVQSVVFDVLGNSYVQSCYNRSNIVNLHVLIFTSYKVFAINFCISGIHFLDRKIYVFP